MNIKSFVVSFLALFFSTFPALWPYIFITDSGDLVKTLALYSVLSGVVSFSTCTVADSIGRHIASKVDDKFAIGYACSILVIGFLLGLFLNYQSSGNIFFISSLLLVLAGLANSISEGFCKGLGKYDLHQYFTILGGVLFLAISYVVRKNAFNLSNVEIISISRFVSVAFSMLFLLPWYNTIFTHRLSLSLSAGNAHSFTLMSILGFLNLLLERILIAKVALHADTAVGRYIFASYQTVSVLNGVRGQFLASLVRLASTDPAHYFRESSKSIRHFLMLSFFLFPIGLIVLLKFNLNNIGENGAALVLVTIFMLLAYVYDGLSAKYGVYFTYTNQASINLNCELIAALIIGILLLAFEITTLSLCVFALIRLLQYVIRTRSFNAK